MGQNTDILPVNYEMMNTHEVSSAIKCQSTFVYN